MARRATTLRDFQIYKAWAWDLGALTLLPQARDTKVAATLEMMRARCSCCRSFMLAMVADCVRTGCLQSSMLYLWMVRGRVLEHQGEKVERQKHEEVMSVVFWVGREKGPELSRMSWAKVGDR